MRRIKLILATIATMALMIIATAPPAMANHLPDEWEVFWWGDWWCVTQWEQRHDESWRVEFFGCWHPVWGW